MLRGAGGSHECVHAPSAISHQSATSTQSTGEKLNTHTLSQTFSHPKQGTNDHVCICRACHHDIDNNIGNCNHVPRHAVIRSWLQQDQLSPCPVTSQVRHKLKKKKQQM